jgi:hypothetical protein
VSRSKDQIIINRSVDEVFDFVAHFRWGRGLLALNDHGHRRRGRSTLAADGSVTQPEGEGTEKRRRSKP